MDISTTLNIGIGRCGNCLVDELIAKSPRYTGLLINSSAGDMDELDFIVKDRGGKYLIPDADGAGRDRKLAEKYAKRNNASLAFKLKGYQLFSTFMFYFSTDGGTGSGCSPVFMRTVRTMFGDDVHIGAVVTMHSKNANKVQRKNMRECWKDIKKLREEGVLDSIFIIDNDTRETIEEINKEGVRYLDAYFRLNELDKSNTIDTTDLSNLNKPKGYKMIFSLNNKKDDIVEAIEDGLNRSVFLRPDKYVSTDKNKDIILSNFSLSDDKKQLLLEAEEDYIYKCQEAMFLLQPNRFKEEEVVKLFKYNGHYTGTFDNNIIALSGMAIPNYKIEEVDDMYSLFNFEEDEDGDDMFSITDDEIKVDSKPKVKKSFSKINLDDVFKSDNWN